MTAIPPDLPTKLHTWAEALDTIEGLDALDRAAAGIAQSMREYAAELVATAAATADNRPSSPFVVTSTGAVLSLCCDALMEPASLEDETLGNALARCSTCKTLAARWWPDPGGWLPIPCSELDACKFGDESAGGRCTGPHGCHGEANR